MQERGGSRLKGKGGREMGESKGEGMGCVEKGKEGGWEGEEERKGDGRERKGMGGSGKN